MRATNVLIFFVLTAVISIQIISSSSEILEKVLSDGETYKVPPIPVVWSPMEYLIPCGENETAKVEFHSRDYRGIFTKQKTQFLCKCDGHRKTWKPENRTQDDENPELYRRNYPCLKDPTKEIRLVGCTSDDPCQYDFLEFYGEDKPGLKYTDRSSKRCRCENTSSCVLNDYQPFRIQYACKEMFKLPQNKPCIGVFKREFYEPNTSSQVGAKLDTGFFCRCVKAVENYTSLPPYQYPLDRNLWSIDYKCPNYYSDSRDTERSCNTSEICKVLQYHDFGKDRIGLKYEDIAFEKCYCSRYRKCVAKELSSEESRNYYCESEKYDYSKLRECRERSVYMEKIYVRENDSNLRDETKMDTKIMCKCDPEKREPYFFDTSPDSTPRQSVYLYRCAEKKNKLGTRNCLEHQVCKRDFLYDYGKDRKGEQYVENIERYCYCRNGMVCKQVSEFSNNYWTKPYDKVLSSRCMKPEPEKKEKIKPCEPNQIYMEVIYRNESVRKDYFEVIRLNTYINCICEYTDESNLGESETRYDPLHPYQWVSTFSCPSSRIPSPKENESCKDYAICRRGVRLDVGEEDPDRLYTQHFTSYCKCDQERSCEKVGKDGYDIIYRCMKKKSLMKKEICAGGEVYRVDIRRDQCQPSGPKKSIRLNTFEECICTGSNLRENSKTTDRDPNHPLQEIIKQICPRYYQVEVDIPPLPYCSFEDVCKTYNYISVGLEKPYLKLLKNTTENCNCAVPLECVYKGDPMSLTQKYRCIGGDTEPTLPICRFDALYKEEIYANFSTPNGGYRLAKKNTLLNCLCESIFYSFVPEMTMIPRTGMPKLRNFYCPPFNSTEDTIRSCSDYAICKIDTYTDYGEDVGPGIRYLRNRKEFCDCSFKGERNCVITERDYPKGASTVNNTYRCLGTDKEESKLIPCSAGQDFLVVVVNETTKEILNTFKKCICNLHKSSIEDLHYRSAVDRADPNQSIRTYICQEPDDYSEELDKPTCDEGNPCYVDHFLPYGREREGKFIFTSNEPCSCAKSQECLLQSRIGGISSFKCEELEVCRPLTFCRKLVYYTTGLSELRKLKRNETTYVKNLKLIFIGLELINETRLIAAFAMVYVIWNLNHLSQKYTGKQFLPHVALLSRMVQMKKNKLYYED